MRYCDRVTASKISTMLTSRVSGSWSEGHSRTSTMLPNNDPWGSVKRYFESYSWRGDFLESHMVMQVNRSGISA